MLTIYLILLVEILQVLGNIQPQYMPPYTCTTTTTLCQQGDKLHGAVSNKGPKGEKGDSCECLIKRAGENSTASLMRHSQSQLPVKGSKGERGVRGEKGDSCKCDHSGGGVQAFEKRMGELEGRVKEMEKIAKLSSGPSLPVALTTTNQDGILKDILRGQLSHLPASCSGVKQTGESLKNVTLYPMRDNFDITPFVVDCSTGGWMVIQRRNSGNLSFYQSFFTYAQGFGDKDGEYWMGLSMLHKLTSTLSYKLRIEMRTKADPETVIYAEYGYFFVENWNNAFRLVVGDYSGNAGDEMSGHNSMKFSAHDRDEDIHATANCGAYHQGGWWYSKCGRGRLNDRYENRFYWGNSQLIYSVMMIRSRC